MLVKYIRDVKNAPVGVIVAVDRDIIGWSMCHPNDHFDRDLAKEIAVGRAFMGEEPPLPVFRNKLKHNIEQELELMRIRSERYFKVNTFE